MLNIDRIGSEDSLVGKKGLYLLMILAIYAILFYGTLAAAPAVRDTVYFYLLFAFILGTVPFLVDNLSKYRESLEDFDTVGIEENDSGVFSARNQLIFAGIVSVLFAFRASSTGSVWVASPSFGIFDSQIGNAFLSGLVGILENHVFFGFFYPTFHAFAYNRTGSGIAAALAGWAGGTAVFLGYHVFRYGTNEIALVSVAIFALVNCILVYFLRSLIVSDALHFTNNFVATLFQIKKVAFSVLI